MVNNKQNVTKVYRCYPKPFHPWNSEVDYSILESGLQTGVSFQNEKKEWQKV